VEARSSGAEKICRGKRHFPIAPRACVCTMRALSPHMLEQHVIKIASELSIQPRQVAATAVLLEEGGTVPFIARYRKERTGELDEVKIAGIRDRLEQLEELDKRRESIVKNLDERKLLTADLLKKIGAAETMNVLEDLYAPFRQKKRTRATTAKEKGLEPLADLLWAQDVVLDVQAAAKEHAGREWQIDEKKGTLTLEDALAGARDIIAERIAEDANARARMRTLYAEKGMIRSKVISGKEEEGAKFKDYFDWSESAASSPSHRVLAMRRGEAEGFLMVRLNPDETEAVSLLESIFVKNKGEAAMQVRDAVHDCQKRLLGFAMEGEARLTVKKRADEEAIRVFAQNIREVLLAAPLGQKAVLGIDPGFRTGCKIVLLDKQGKLIGNDVIFPDREPELATRLIKAAIEKFHVEAIAIGNGTASRETDAFVRSLKLPASIPIVMVNESGASIYSASEIAREEFPDKDITVRGAVSIGRRLMDPLAELVKLDPKSIGVGQYQHDVDQTALKKQLDDVVTSCVNNVGVELNTASKNLLAYVSGLNARVAGNIVAHRDENGPFKSRKELLKVTGLGPKAFEQAAGFLRIRDGANPLDTSAVHPERYELVEKMAGEVGCSVGDLLTDEQKRSRIDLKKYVSEEVGLPTLTDIVRELAKPGRDPRAQFEAFNFGDVHTMNDLKPGQKLPGIVTNVTAFGAFVDIGVHQDGLVHVSQLSDDFVKNAADVVKPGQKVNVTVVEIDIPRKRIALSMKAVVVAGKPGERKPEVGKRDLERHTGSAKPAPAVDWFTLAQQKK
jgi:uncharacterized protein